MTRALAVLVLAYVGLLPHSLARGTAGQPATHDTRLLSGPVACLGGRRFEMRCPPGLVIAARNPEWGWRTRAYRLVLRAAGPRRGHGAGTGWDCVILYADERTPRDLNALSEARAVGWLRWPARFLCEKVATHTRDREIGLTLFVRAPRTRVWVHVMTVIPAEAYPYGGRRLIAFYRSFRFLPGTRQGNRLPSAPQVARRPRTLPRHRRKRAPGRQEHRTWFSPASSRFRS